MADVDLPWALQAARAVVDIERGGTAAMVGGGYFLRAILRRSENEPLDLMELSVLGNLFLPRPNDGAAYAERKRRMRVWAIGHVEDGCDLGEIVNRCCERANAEEVAALQEQAA